MCFLFKPFGLSSKLEATFGPGQHQGYDCSWLPKCRQNHPFYTRADLCDISSKYWTEEAGCCIDYEWEDEKIADIGAIRYVLNSSFREPRSSPPKNEPFSQGVRLNIRLLSQGLKFYTRF